MGKKNASNRRRTDLEVNGHTSRKHKKSGKTRKDDGKHFAIEDLITKVEENMDNLNFELAETFSEQALEASPDNQQALNLAASVFLENGKAEKAADCLRHAIDVDKEKGHAKYMMLGQLLEGEEAVECFKKGIQLMIEEKQLNEKKNNSEVNSTNTNAEVITNRDISNAFCSLAEIYLTDCCFSENAETSCKVYCEEAIEHDPSNPEAYQALANFLLSEEKNEDAKEMLSKSLDLWQAGEDSSLKGTLPSYESRISLSKMLIEVEEFDNACNLLEGLLVEDDEVVQVWYLLGWIYHLSGQDADAVKYYLERAKTLFIQTECDDGPLLEHTEELLLEINGNVATTGTLQRDDENGENGINKDEDNEKMDTVN